MQVKVNKFNDAMFQEMFLRGKNDSLEDLKNWVCEAIKNNMVSSNVKKLSFIRAIRGCNSNNQVVSKASNMFLSGEGLKVL